MNNNDPYRLQRFVDAQNSGGIFEQARNELRSGRKQGHWIWFIFPQIKGLGFSPTTVEYSISSLAEAAAYLSHPVLGPRLRKCTELVLELQGFSAGQIFGPDDVKFRSSMTLFSKATTDNQLFLDILNKYFGGQADPATIQRL